MYDRYESPFCTRYASDEMQYVFSADNKFKTWRKLWIALAKAEKKQGLPITQQQIDELEMYKDQINYDVAIARDVYKRQVLVPADLVRKFILIGESSTAAANLPAA